MATRAQIIEIYTGYYDRAADATGLAYWETNGADMTADQVAQSFADQDETKAKYPDTLSTANFVNEIYKNVFNRDADPDGLAYWSTALDDKTVSTADMILAVMNGAQGDDQKTLDNKSTVSDDFASSGLNDYDNSVAALKDVTADDKTVIAAGDQIDQWQKEFANFTMTTSKDELVGTEADEAFAGKFAPTDATYQAIDSIDGGDGQDALKLSIGSLTAVATVPSATIENIEKIIVDNTTSTVGNTASINFANIDSSVTSVEQTSTANMTYGTGTAGKDITAVISDVKLLDTVALTTTFNYEGRAIAGNDDTMNFDLASTAAKTQTIVADGIENFSLTSEKASQTVAITPTTSTSVKTLTLKGTENIDLTGTSGTFSTINGADAKGDLTIVAGAINTSSSTISTGFGNDTIADGAGADTIKAGNGNDTITASSGNDALYGEAGNDTITSGSGSNTIIGGTGKDGMTSGGTDTFKFAFGDTGTTTATMDTITSFTSTTDKLSFGLSVGSGDNFKLAAAAVATYDAALKAANADFSGDSKVIYSFQNDGTNGYVFVDFDHDGQADGTIELLGITSLVVADIIA